MRDYAKISPAFWTGQTGRKLRSLGPECQLLGLYLITTHHANMLGLYYLPLAYVHADTGLSLEGASKGLASLSEAGFCLYDAASEWVFVVEMARFQVLKDGEPLDPKDKRALGIQKDYRTFPENPFLLPFYQKYASSFHLSVPRGEPWEGMPLGRGFDAPPKPGAGTGAGAGPIKTATRAGEPPSRTEVMIRECFVEHADFITENFPDLVLVLEVEECVTKYRGQSIGADPWLIVLRWLRNAKEKADGKLGSRYPGGADASAAGAEKLGSSLDDEMCSRPPLDPV